MSQHAFSSASRALGLGQFDQAEGLYRSIPAGARSIPMRCRAWR